MNNLPPPLQVAVLGSGPAGCFLAQGLLRALPHVQITIFDRLATPFGLIRYGVAADHQHTKTITRQFERLFTSPQVQFAGNVDVGVDLTLEETRTHFDVVVLATGLPRDRKLPLLGSDREGVVGAGLIVSILNTHPAERSPLPDLHGRVVIVGSGNVGIDLLRFLVKGRSDYEGSDIADATLTSHLDNPATDVTIVSRSHAPFAKSDPQMIRELATLQRATYTSPDLGKAAPPDGDRQATSRLAAYTELTSGDRGEHPGPRVTLRFGLTPRQMTGADRVSGVEFVADEGTVSIPADVVVTAIGFEAPEEQDEIAALTAVPSETGRIEAGLYRAGWAKRGPTGSIPENRSCAKSVIEEIVSDFTEGKLEPVGERAGFSGLAPEIREASVSYEEWLNIDRHEREAANDGRIRKKIPTQSLMVSVAKNHRPPSQEGS